jgi:CheY-like chemotaxis protein
MSSLLEDISRVMQKTYGKDIFPFDESFLLKTVEKRLASTSISSFTSYSDYLSENSAEADALFRALTISYSEFFRNPLTFALIEQLVIPVLLDEKEKSGRSEIRIWSAACAAGQEAYSVAILLDELTAARGSVVPDLILMDISLPVTDGFTALEQIRADEALCLIPVVALTARAMAGDREEILARGFDGYLSKPIDEDLFHQTIREALDAN